MSSSWTALVVLAAVASCQKAEGSGTARAKAPLTKPKPPPVETDVTAQDYQMPALPRGRVVLKDAYGGSHIVAVEVAYTRDARTRGLMWRTSLPEGTGMLFIFKGEEPLSFWMRNTLIPLDMIFLDKDARIVGIVERAAPQTRTSRTPGRPAQYVLEVPGGWSEKIGLKAGLPAQLEGVAGLVGDP